MACLLAFFSLCKVWSGYEICVLYSERSEAKRGDTNVHTCKQEFVNWVGKEDVVLEVASKGKDGEKK